MGTNYYWYQQKLCTKCGRNDDGVHIGKSSHGWCFSLAVNEEIKNLDNWKKKFEDGVIKDEYGDIIPVKEMLSIITERYGHNKFNEPFPETIFFPKDYSWDRFFYDNHCERGPNGLVRHKIGESCIAHGDGTWDLLNGYFS